MEDSVDIGDWNRVIEEDEEEPTATKLSTFQEIYKYLKNGETLKHKKICLAGWLRKPPRYLKILFF